MQAVDVGLAQAAAERAAHEPLQLHPARRPDRQVVGQPRVRLIGAHPRALQLLTLQQAAVAREQRRVAALASQSRGRRSAARET